MGGGVDRRVEVGTTAAGEWMAVRDPYLLRELDMGATAELVRAVLAAADAVDDRDRPSVGDWSVAMAVCGIEVATANEVRRLARTRPESRSSGAVSQGEEDRREGWCGHEPLDWDDEPLDSSQTSGGCGSHDWCVRPRGHAGFCRDAGTFEEDRT